VPCRISSGKGLLWAIGERNGHAMKRTRPPTDRTEAIKTLVEKAGGKLVTAYMTTGTNDVVLVTELPDGSERLR
jgi:uncharacterized protein with GYD domain